ncbi:hypothetical protein LINPERHAP1_LOCUS7507 [Linum perenne]
MAYSPPLVEEQGPVEAIDELPSYVEPTEEWTQFRHNLAQEMWATRDILSTKNKCFIYYYLLEYYASGAVETEESSQSEWFEQ